MTITIAVAGRIATATATTQVVAGNTYPVAVSLDSEWTGNLFMRVRFGSLYYDIPFASTDTAVDVQFPVGYPEVGIGIFSEALQVCTSEVRMRLLRSILEAGEQVVEFDSDLYDQWAGEVSELLCDDAFDSTSDRPVKNSVLTAWKDTVPLDANLVHKTGNESIAGNKTFTATMNVKGTAQLVPRTVYDAGTPSTYFGWKGRISIIDHKDGAESTVGDILCTSVQTYGEVSMRAYKPDRSAFSELRLRDYADFQSLLIPSHYPTSNGNPIAPAEGEAMSSGMIAVDPRIVHTTGNETVAGNKTFNGMIVWGRYAGSRMASDMDPLSPPNYTERGLLENRAGDPLTGTVLMRDAMSYSSTANWRNIIVHAYDENGTDTTATLMVVAYRDGTTALRFVRGDGTYVDLVPKG